MNNKISKEPGTVVDRLYVQMQNDLSLEVSYTRNDKYYFIRAYAGTEQIINITYLRDCFAAQKIAQGLVLEYSGKESRINLWWMGK